MMKTIDNFILEYLEEFDEDTPHAIINTYGALQSVEANVVDLIFGGISRLHAAGRVTLAEERDNSYGASDMTLLLDASEDVLEAWKRGTIWDVKREVWTWDRPMVFRPYVVLGHTRRWRTATPEEIAEDFRRAAESE